MLLRPKCGVVNNFTAKLHFRPFLRIIFIAFWPKLLLPATFLLYRDCLSSGLLLRLTARITTANRLAHNRTTQKSRLSILLVCTSSTHVPPLSGVTCHALFYKSYFFQTRVLCIFWSRQISHTKLAISGPSHVGMCCE